MPTNGASEAIYERPAEILQQLIRFDTTNPPGNEAGCIGWCAGLLREAGVQTRILALDPARPNLVARLPGAGQAPPLLLQGHIDVVTTAHQAWQHDPFGGEEIDGYIWGRGTLDMKGGVAMMLAAVLRAKAEGLVPPGDVILALVSDEESTGIYGAKYLVEEHPDVFAGVRYALGEFGGFSLHLAGRCFYPIMVAEKQLCGVKVTISGPGGHGAYTMRGGTMARLGQVLKQLDTHRLPVHITPVTRQMIAAMAGALPAPLGPLVGGLLDPGQTDALLDRLGPVGALFDPLLHNMINATVVRGGEQPNVIPSQVELILDGRALPGFEPAEMLAEVRALLGDDVGLEITASEPGRAEADLTLYPVLAGILQEADPAGTPIPYMLPAVTDGRIFARLGIQSYGFLPMQLPADFSFATSIHAADERIPVAAMTFGAQAMYEALRRFGQA